MERTEVNISSNFPLLNVNDRALFLGSCFSENIGRKFQEYKLQATVNPLGVVFHPIPLFNQIKRALSNDFYIESDFFEFNDYWFNYELSGSCAKFDKQEAVSWANKKLGDLKQNLKESERLFLSLGSAVERSFLGHVVANCHKQPIKNFERKITGVQTLVENISPVLDSVFALNPNLKIYFTVSPVRHLKEGLLDNTISKSTLILLCQELCNRFNNVEYLPIYEVVIDELRDYSFFKDDLLHPNDKAVEYIWHKLISSLASSELKTYLEDSSKLLKAFNHKSLYPKSISNISFLNNLKLSLAKHQKEYNLNWREEIEIVKEKLENMA